MMYKSFCASLSYYIFAIRSICSRAYFHLWFNFVPPATRESLEDSSPSTVDVSKAGPECRGENALTTATKVRKEFLEFFRNIFTIQNVRLTHGLIGRLEEENRSLQACCRYGLCPVLTPTRNKTGTQAPIGGISR